MKQLLLFFVISFLFVLKINAQDNSKQRKIANDYCKYKSNGIYDKFIEENYNAFRLEDNSDPCYLKGDMYLYINIAAKITIVFDNKINAKFIFLDCDWNTNSKDGVVRYMAEATNSKGDKSFLVYSPTEDEFYMSIGNSVVVFYTKF